MTQRVYYIAESYRLFREYLRQHNLTASDEQFIESSREERLRGKVFTAEQVVLCYDPRMRASFWQLLQHALAKGAGR